MRRLRGRWGAVLRGALRRGAGVRQRGVPRGLRRRRDAVRWRVHQHDDEQRPLRRLRAVVCRGRGVHRGGVRAALRRADALLRRGLRPGTDRPRALRGLRTRVRRGRGVRRGRVPRAVPGRGRGLRDGRVDDAAVGCVGGADFARRSGHAAGIRCRVRPRRRSWWLRVGRLPCATGRDRGVSWAARVYVVPTQAYGPDWTLWGAQRLPGSELRGGRMAACASLPCWGGNRTN
jgi:hypothetical protein